jgi:CubicO group peptidase (beta-lactamase class C family)
MTRYPLAVAVLAVTLAPLPARPQPAPTGEWRADVDRFARSLVEAHVVAGMGIAVTQDDRVVYSRGFGLADTATNRLVDERTRFYIASSTKALTATAVLATAARGRLDLGASIATYLPALRGRGRLNADAVTVRDLLTMSHGIELGGPVGFRAAYTGEFPPQLMLELLAEHRQSRTGQFEYGNLGYNILGLVLDSRRSDGWKDVVRSEVLEPLGMRETSARVSDFQPDLIALPHDYTAEGTFQRIRLGKADANMHAAGGHFASARDLGRFVAAHASGGRLDGVQVFPREMIASAHRKHVDQNARYGPFVRSGWGYGWDLGSYGDEALVSRFGSFSGYRSHMSFMPGRGIGVVVLVNANLLATSTADVMATYIYDRLTNKPNLDLTAKLGLSDLRARAEAIRTNLAKDAADRKARQVPLPRPLQDYAGAYANNRFGRMEWRVTGGKLEVRMGVASSEAELYDAASHQVRVTIAGERELMEFVVPSAGPARAVNYRNETFERVKE